MTEIFKNIMKFISRNFGFLLINFSMLLILLLFFMNSSINNIDSLKTDLETSIQEGIFAQSGIAQSDLEQVTEYCKSNPQDERCSQLNSINATPEFNQLFDDIKSAKNYINTLIYVSIGLFLIGFLFVYLAMFNIIITLYNVSVHLTIHSFFAALYFNFIPSIFNKIPLTQQFKDLTREVPQEFVQKLLEIISNWIKTPLQETIKLTIILGVIFLIISIILYFVKKKALKDKNKEK